MLDCTNNIRQCYLNLLEGNVIYNGNTIKVYGQEPFTTAPNTYITLGSITEVADNNNQRFVTDADIDINIIVEQYKRPDLSVVDAISSLVLNLILPTTGIQDVGDAYFQIFPLSRISSRYLPLDNGDLYISRKILTINNSVIQK
jgi:hypothetical protein